jgi:hypothetical protein
VNQLSAPELRVFTNPLFALFINTQSPTGGYVIITPVRNEGQYLQKTVD